MILNIHQRWQKTKPSARRQLKSCLIFNKCSPSVDYRVVFLLKTSAQSLFSPALLVCIKLIPFFTADFSQCKKQAEIYLQPSVVCPRSHLLVTKWQNPAHPHTDFLKRQKNGGKGAYKTKFYPFPCCLLFWGLGKAETQPV